MHLNRIVLPALDIDEVASFYRMTLGLPVQTEKEMAAVTVGRTQLEFRTAGRAVGPHHLAMTIPRSTFGLARSLA